MKPEYQGWADPWSIKAVQYCRLAIRHGSPEADELLARVSWMLPGLSVVIVEHAGRTPAEFRRMVRRYVYEQTFLEDAGDPVIDPRTWRDTRALLTAADRVHRVLRRRVSAREGFAQGQQASPATMFG
ncbi:MAG: hypothetical protein AAGG38_05045 [Planctomycetota bacterium]